MHIHVNARRWFDRKNGNTYHTVSCIIVIGGEVILDKGTTSMVYGYGDQWQETATTLIFPTVRNKNVDFIGLRSFFHGHNGVKDGIVYTYDVCDVSRKGDLHV